MTLSALLKQLEESFNRASFFIDGKSMQVHAELGISCYPANGKILSQLIGVSLPKNTARLASKTELTL